MPPAIEHIALEDQILVPALREADAWGNERADKLIDRHHIRREELKVLRKPCSSAGTGALAGELTRFIEVGSRGNPIPPATLPFIFDAFHQGRAVSPSRTQGLGLGLYIAQQIACSHGGSIAVTSSEGDGTTFRVRLPRDAAAR